SNIRCSICHAIFNVQLIILTP
ncbi:MAG: hypothetical protein E7418_04715, partial [Ruminococcaceae bacterium]|nr:hypothetical protein [Oscillospiraceae bacterium]